MTECRWNVPWEREVYNGYSEGIQNVGLQGYMTTPMESNLKLMSDASSESVDSMMYHQMIVSLMYLMNTRPYIGFSVKTLS